MRYIVILLIAVGCAHVAQARDEPWLQLHPPEPPKEEKKAEAQPVWNCETGAWEFDASGNLYQLDAPASDGPYDKDGNPASLPEDHGTYTATAFARPGSTLVNGQCFIDTSEGQDFKLPVGAAIVRSSATVRNGTQGWTCSAILPYYTNARKKLSMSVPGLDHLPHITIKAVVSYCYVGTGTSSPPGDSSK